MHLADVSRALMALSAERREALLLVGAGGFSYEEAAEVCGCALGTIKSRVARGRAQLSAMIEGGRLPGREEAAQDIIAQLERIRPTEE